VMDPEGNKIELWEPGVPFAKEASNGKLETGRRVPEQTFLCGIETGTDKNVCPACKS